MTLRWPVGYREPDEAPVADARERTPSELVIVLSAPAIVGVASVLATLTIGAPGWAVGLTGVVALSICAAAPWLALEAFVGRPLRHVLALLRSARDGEPLIGRLPRLSGIVGDLVRVANDILAVQIQVGRYAMRLSETDTLRLAGDDAIRAFKAQTQALAEIARRDDNEARRASQGLQDQIALTLQQLQDVMPRLATREPLNRIEAHLKRLYEVPDRRAGREGDHERLQTTVAQVAAAAQAQGQSLGHAVAQARDDLRDVVMSASAQARKDAEAQAARLTSLLDKVERLAAAPSQRREGSAADLAGALRPIETALAGLQSAASADAREAGALRRDFCELRDLLLQASAQRFANGPGIAGEPDERLAAIVETLARLEAALVARPPHSPSEALAELQSALAASSSIQARRLDELETRLLGQLLTVDRTSVAAGALASRSLTPEASGLDVGALKIEFVALGARFDEAFSSQVERWEALASRIVGAARAHDRTAIASALTVFRAMTRNFVEATEKFDAATTRIESRASTSPEGAARGETLSAIEERIERFAREQAAGFEALSGRLVGKGVAFDRTAVASALTVFRGLARSFAAATDRFDTATALIERRADAPPVDPASLEPVAAAFEERLDRFAREQSEAFEALSQRIVGQTAGLDRTAVASALTVFRAMTRHFSDAIEALKSTPPGPAADDAAVRDALAAHADKVGAALAEVAWRLDAIGERAASPPAGFEAAAHDLGDRVAQAIAELERRLTPTGSRRNDAALAKVVGALAHSVDARFNEIEGSLQSLVSDISHAGVRQQKPPLSERISDLSKIINESTSTLKLGVHELLGVSAAVIQEINSKNSQPEAFNSVI